MATKMGSRNARTRNDYRKKVDEQMRALGYVNAWEAAEALGCHYTTVVRWLQEKKLPGKQVKVGVSGALRWYVNTRSAELHSADATMLRRLV
jgi:hypothetical protein